MAYCDCFGKGAIMTARWHISEVTLLLQKHWLSETYFPTSSAQAKLTLSLAKEKVQMAPNVYGTYVTEIKSILLPRTVPWWTFPLTNHP